jgi:cellulose synthase/poly-beta-1,6-N-acetylglucosamine synthase-like glycosyltransferase
VIVVDDGSSDGSLEIAARHGAKVICQEHRGAAAARNRGVAEALGQILLFTDADCEPLPDWIEQMVAALADPEAVGVKGVYRTRQRSWVARFAQAEYEEKYNRLAHAEKIDFIDTYAAGYRRDVFLRSGGFDAAFLYDEDQELSFRLAGAGHKLMFAPSAAVYHRHPDTVLGYIRRKVPLGRWKVRVHARHPARALRDSYTPWTQKAQLLLLPLTVAAAVAAAANLAPWAFVGALGALGLISTIPLMIIAARQGWSVMMMVPILAGLRALALEIGLVWGLASEIYIRARTNHIREKEKEK